jgi:hypothetical protein
MGRLGLPLNLPELPEVELDLVFDFGIDRDFGLDGLEAVYCFLEVAHAPVHHLQLLQHNLPLLLLHLRHRLGPHCLL